MISPDVAAAVTRLARDGLLAPEQVRLFGRVARGELVSLSTAIQALLYLGIVAMTTGVGLLLRDRIADLGPMRVARREPLLALGLLDRRSGWPLEMVLRAAHAGWTIVDVPVAYHERAGRSKVTGTVRGTLRAVNDMGRLLRDEPATYW